MTLSNAIAIYLKACKIERNLSHLTLRAYALDLAQFLAFARTGFSGRNFDSPVLIQGFLEYLTNTQKHKASSLKRKVAVLRSFMKFLCCRSLIGSNPFDNLTVRLRSERRLPKVLNLTQVMDILRSARTAGNEARSTKQVFIASRDYALLEILFYSGARIGEVLMTNILDYDATRRMAIIRGKGKRERLIDLDCEPVVLALSAYLLSRAAIAHSEPALFVSRTGKRLTAHSAERIVRKYALAANISCRVTPHFFRHTMATLMLENGADLRSIQEILGHASISTTEIYTHVSTARKRQVMSAFHPRSLAVNRE